MLNVILSPLSYLTIRNAQKALVDWVYPVVLAAASTWAIFYLGGQGAITGTGGLIERVLLVCSVLPGFYIAALAGIATFNRPGMDDVMPAPAPKLSARLKGKKVMVEMTRRRFLSLLFAFLCWESVALMIACIFGAVLAKGLIAHVPQAMSHLVVAVCCFIFLLAFWQMIFTTFLGLFYLGDRLHRPTY